MVIIDCGGGGGVVVVVMVVVFVIEIFVCIKTHVFMALTLEESPLKGTLN